jgi:hypothetical protein
MEMFTNSVLVEFFIKYTSVLSNLFTTILDFLIFSKEITKINQIGLIQYG